MMDLPPSDGRSLTSIVQSVEQKGLGVIQSVEYERDWWTITGRWKVTACNERCLKLYIDPRSGEEVRRKSDDLEDELPPPNTQGAAAIAKSFEGGKRGYLLEMEFEHGAWKVEFREERGLLGALKPSRQRVYQPTAIPASEQSKAPRLRRPMESAPGEPPRLPASRNEIRV
jgi:hypothetical protein